MRLLFGILICLALTGPVNAAKFAVHNPDKATLVVSLKGQIELNDPKKLLAILASVPFAEHKLLSLNSIGGWVHSAIELGLIVRHYGFKTVIPRNAICVSACSMVFVAGWDDKMMVPARYKHAQSQLGVHRPYQKNFQTADPEVMKAVQTYLDFMKAGTNFTTLTMSTSSRTLRFIQNAELKAMGNYQIMGLTGTRSFNRSRKNKSRTTGVRSNQNLEQWRRSILENAD